MILRDGLQRRTETRRTHFIWMTPEQERRWWRSSREAGGSSTCTTRWDCIRADGPYLDLVGGRYIGHGPLERFRVEVVDAGPSRSPAASQPSSSPTSSTRPLMMRDASICCLRNRSDDGKVVAAAGWVCEPGRGRLCHLANGHTREALLHPMYQRLMCNAINWCLRHESK